MKETNNSTESKDYVVCPRCGQEVFKEAIICPFCKFGILAYMNGDIGENGDPIKKSDKN